MKLDMKDEEVKRKMLREDDRAIQKTGGAIKDYMTNNGQWGLKSAARLARKRKDDDRNQGDYNDRDYYGGGGSSTNCNRAGRVYDY